MHNILCALEIVWEVLNINFVLRQWIYSELADLNLCKTGKQVFHMLSVVQIKSVAYLAANLAVDNVYIIEDFELSVCDPELSVLFELKS